MQTHTLTANFDVGIVYQLAVYWSCEYISIPECIWYVVSTYR